ncbi:Low molecular weight protein tyrosine phosphatase [hydrothermal vent metagenome]|uniref:Low molecular weight protein tyrosine phosphatase n=1 Tax=hydrothermal vent metagenome TaxID=652676 RepID=A0A3B0Z308_9ZZZZ
MQKKKVNILFVCLGNICRSPTAEGVFRHWVEQEGEADWITIDSAGTHAYHVGASPDSRAQHAAQKRGVDLSALRGRQATIVDFEEFDYVLAMDEENFNNLAHIAPDDQQHKIKMFLKYAENFDETDVPDPYYGGSQGFEHVLDLIEDASQGLLEHLRQT